MRNFALVLINLSLICSNALSEEIPLDVDQQRAEDILHELIELESTEQRPEETLRAAEAMASRLREAGFPEMDLTMFNPEPAVYALIVRYRGRASKQPILFMAHLDVMPASSDDWSFPPFEFGKSDGYYFGRGTQDNKTGVSHLVSNFIRLKQENFIPERDLIIVLSGDEETNAIAISSLAEEHKDLIAAEYALNTDVGDAYYSDDMQPHYFQVQNSEKLYQTYRLKTTNRGGHSALPRPDNAINQLARALVNIAEFRFPVQLSSETRLMLRRLAPISTEPLSGHLLAAASENPDPASVEFLSSIPEFNAKLRTTCVATGLEGGHAENALPREASATINCRNLPGVHPDDTRAVLAGVIADPGVTIESNYTATPSPSSVLKPEFLELLEELVHEQWPGVFLIPEMSSGATDGKYVRIAGIPVFGMNGWFKRPGDDRAHELNEKIGIREFHDGLQFWYQVIKRLGNS